MNGCNANMLGEMIPRKHNHLVVTILVNVTRNMMTQISANGANHLITRPRQSPTNAVIHMTMLLPRETSTLLLAAIMPRTNDEPQPRKL